MNISKTHSAFTEKLRDTVYYLEKPQLFVWVCMAIYVAVLVDPNSQPDPNPIPIVVTHTNI